MRKTILILVIVFVLSNVGYATKADSRNKDINNNVSGKIISTNNDILKELKEYKEELDKIVTEEYVYSLFGQVHTSNKEIELHELIRIIYENRELTYENYAYYRGYVKNTSNREILKGYSEGIIELDEQGNIDYTKKLTKREVLEIVERIENPLNISRPEYKEKHNVPIVMYHEINKMPKNGSTGLYVSKEEFVKQLDALQKAGYTTITMEQLYNHWEHKVTLPEKPIVLTFDDGYVSHYEFASVELAKRGMVGTFYIITGYLKDGSVASAKNLKKMYEIGMEIGSHTVNHADARYTSKNQLKKEYEESKKYLEEITGSEVKHLCYPIGANTTYAKQLLRELGYTTAVKTTPGIANKKQGYTDLKRVRADYNDSVQGFLNKIK